MDFVKIFQTSELMYVLISVTTLMMLIDVLLYLFYMRRKWHTPMFALSLLTLAICAYQEHGFFAATWLINAFLIHMYEIRVRRRD